MKEGGWCKLNSPYICKALTISRSTTKNVESSLQTNARNTQLEISKLILFCWSHLADFFYTSQIYITVYILSFSWLPLHIKRSRGQLRNFFGSLKSRKIKEQVPYSALTKISDFRYMTTSKRTTQQLLGPWLTTSILHFFTQKLLLQNNRWW